MDESIESAPAMLGSNLLSAAITRLKEKPLPASSGCSGLDASVLDKGFRYGEITSIAGASGTGKSLVSLNNSLLENSLMTIDQVALNAIASHLLNQENDDVAFIDTTGSFSPLHLREVVTYRLLNPSKHVKYRQSGYVYAKVQLKVETETEDAIQDKAAGMLDRVKIMRVFDFAGVVEAVGEIGEVWDTYQRNLGPLNELLPRRSFEEYAEIVDSQDDGDEEVNDNEQGAGERSTLAVIATDECQALRPARVGMIVIDNISNIVGSTMSRSQAQGHALLTTLMRSLRHLTSNHYICTLLINAVVGANASKNLNYARHHEDQASIFSSTPGKPALGKTYSYLIDTSMLLSTVPKTKDDAEIQFGGAEKDPSYWESIRIMEVLEDKKGTREGRWAAFEIVNDVELRLWK